MVDCDKSRMHVVISKITTKIITKEFLYNQQANKRKVKQQQQQKKR